MANYKEQSFKNIAAFIYFKNAWSLCWQHNDKMCVCIQCYVFTSNNSPAHKNTSDGVATICSSVGFACDHDIRSLENFSYLYQVLITKYWNIFPTLVPSAQGIWWAQPPKTKHQAPLNWNMKHYKSVEFLSNFQCQAPYWRFLVTVAPHPPAFMNPVLEDAMLFYCYYFLLAKAILVGRNLIQIIRTSCYKIE